MVVQTYETRSLGQLAVSPDGARIAIDAKADGSGARIDVFGLVSGTREASVDAMAAWGLVWSGPGPLLSWNDAHGQRLHRLRDGASMLLRAQAVDDRCAVVAFDDAGHFERSPDVGAVVQMRTGDHDAPLVDSGPAFDRWTVPALWQRFVDGR